MPNLDLKMRAEKTAEILFYDEIGMWGITAQAVVAALKEVKGKVDTLNVRIHSPGGSVFDGVAIFNALKRFEARVEVDIDGIALSIASYIALAGDVVRAVDNTQYMIHNPWVMTMGESTDLRAVADRMDATKADLVRAYSSKTGIGSEELSTMMNAETWLGGEEALNLGFVDELTEALPVAAKFNGDLWTRFKNQDRVASLRANGPVTDKAAEDAAEDKRKKMTALRDRANLTNTYLRKLRGN